MTRLKRPWGGGVDENDQNKCKTKNQNKKNENNNNDKGYYKSNNPYGGGLMTNSLFDTSTQNIESEKSVHPPPGYTRPSDRYPAHAQPRADISKHRATTQLTFPIILLSSLLTISLLHQSQVIESAHS